MATSRRQDILSSLKTIIEGLGLLNTVELNLHIPQDLDVAEMPAVFIYSGSDALGVEQTGGVSETFVWDIEVVCITHDNVAGESSDIEYIVAEVHRAIMADHTISEEVDRIARSGSNPDRSFDLSGLKTSNALIYQVIYEHKRGEI